MITHAPHLEEEATLCWTTHMTLGRLGTTPIPTHGTFDQLDPILQPPTYSKIAPQSHWTVITDDKNYALGDLAIECHITFVPSLLQK